MTKCSVSEIYVIELLECNPGKVISSRLLDILALFVNTSCGVK